METIVFVRGTDAGVFIGRLTHKTEDEVELKDAQRISIWDGAASVSWE